MKMSGKIVVLMGLLLLPTALFLYATILVYQQIGMGAIVVGTAFFAALYGGIAWGLRGVKKTFEEE